MHHLRPWIRNPTVFQRIICQPGWMASHFLSVPSNLRTVALDSQTFAGSPRGAEKERHARMDTGKCNIEFPQGLQGVGVPQPLSHPLLHALWQIYVVGIRGPCHLYKFNNTKWRDLRLLQDCSTPTPAYPPTSMQQTTYILPPFSSPFPPTPYTPARKTDLRYMIGGKKLLSRPRS